jgi:hypothetical protein
MSLSDTMIHFREPLESRQRCDLEAEMRALDGVIAPRFNKPQLLVVAYDPQRTSAYALLEAVRHQGYAASLAGI